MADEFSFLTDSEDERAVEDVLSQAMDHSVLEQIAAINCSSFSNSGSLPSDLETRFRKLKSLPATTRSAAVNPRFPPSKSKSVGPRSGDDFSKTVPAFSKSVDFERIPDMRKSSEKSSPTDTPEEHSDEKKATESKRKPKSSSNTDSNKVSKQKDLKSKSGTDSPKSRSDSWSYSLSPESDSGTVSPPRRRVGCLWCSPKKEKSVSRKQGKENRLWCSSSLGSDYDCEFLKTFSSKEQRKIMKKAMKEEEKINREAEKIVKWAKQASARMMDVSGLDDHLSDLEK